MFESKSKEEIFKLLPKLNNVINNIAKIPIRDNDYQIYISSYKNFEINPDIQLFGYEKAIIENRYVEKEYPELAKKIWMFARSGQGDEWFFAKDSNLILYYDHNLGEYQSIDKFINFNLLFFEFLQIAFLYRDLETRLDEVDDNLSSEEKQEFIQVVSNLDENFYKKYPYVYFDN